MLAKIDLTQKLSKKEYNKIMKDLGERLGLAQRAARDANRPIIIVFEGWRGSHRSAVINDMMQHMDARGFNVLSTVRMGHNSNQPFFTYFWENLPADGHIAVYHRSWYYLKNDCDMNHDHHHEASSVVKDMTYAHINAFEKVLTDDNYIVLKYFLHVSKETQEKRVEKQEKTLGKAWREINPAYDETGRYKEYYEQYDTMLSQTSVSLSQGEQQLIAIGRAFLSYPQILILDEATSALDVSVQAQVLNLLNDLKRKYGYTYIFISHDLSVVRFLSDRIMVMQRGKIVESGTADDIYNHPQQEYTQNLIASIPRI